MSVVVQPNTYVDGGYDLADEARGQAYREINRSPAWLVTHQDILVIRLSAKRTLDEAIEATIQDHDGDGDRTIWRGPRIVAVLSWSASDSPPKVTRISA